MKDDKTEIKKLKDGECYTIPESDYGKAEVWKIHNLYFLFEIPTFGGEPRFIQTYTSVESLLSMVTSWT